MKQQETEKSYLIRQLPDDLKKYPKLIIRAGNFFDPNAVDSLRIRQKGDQYELTKKEGDTAHQRIEHTVHIKKEEFEIIWPVAQWKYEKERYLYPLGKHIAEIDIYLGKIKGYARVEVEFENDAEAAKFKPPAWFGREITEWNHSIHLDIGSISFEDLRDRYKEKGIELKPISLQ